MMVETGGTLKGSDSIGEDMDIAQIPTSGRSDSLLEGTVPAGAGGDKKPNLHPEISDRLGSGQWPRYGCWL